MARWKTLVLGGIAAVLVGTVVWHNGMFQQDMGYIESEMASSRFEHAYGRWSLPAITAYARYFYHLGVSPVLFIPFLVALVPYLRRGPARAEMVSWLLVPVVAFSLVVKKHPNYVFAVLPVFPIITVLGLMAVPFKRFAHTLLVFLFLAAGIQWMNRTFPSPHRFLSRYLGPYDRVPAMNRAFEFEFVPSIEPRSTFRHAREARLLYRQMSELACSASNLVQILFPGDFQDVRYILLAKNPCVDIVSWPDVQRLAIARWVLVSDASCRLLEPRDGQEDRAGAGPRTAENEPWAEMTRNVVRSGRYMLLDKDVTRSPCLYVFARRPGS